MGCPIPGCVYPTGTPAAIPPVVQPGISSNRAVPRARAGRAGCGTRPVPRCSSFPFAPYTPSNAARGMVPTLIPSCAKLPVKSSEVLSAQPLLALGVAVALHLRGCRSSIPLVPGLIARQFPCLAQQGWTPCRRCGSEARSTVSCLDKPITNEPSKRVSALP